MKQVLVALFCFLCCGSYAQFQINATDGNTDHPDYVEVTWTSPEGVVEITRIHTKKDETNTIPYKQNGILGDATAVPGIVYIYTAECRTASGETITKTNKGHRPLPPPIAIEELREYSEIFASSPVVRLKDSILIAQPKIKGKWRKNKKVNIETITYNIGYGTIENVKVASYISDDMLLDDTDQLIDESPIEDLSGFSSPTDVNSKLKLPKGKYYGKYLIMAVYQAETIKAMTYKKIVKE